MLTCPGLLDLAMKNTARTVIQYPAYLLISLFMFGLDLLPSPSYPAENTGNGAERRKMFLSVK